MSSTWNSTSARIGSVPAESAEARRFLQHRLAIFAGATTAIGAMFLLVSYGAPLLVIDSPASRYGELGRGAHLAGTLLLLAVWLLTRARRVLSARALATLDGSVVIAGCFSWSVMGLGLGGDTGLFTGILACVVTCIVRAVVVPTTVARTLWTTAIALVPLPIVVYLGAVDPTPTPRMVAPVLVVQAAMWAASGLAVALVATRVVYGLQEKVREAQQLGQYTLEHRIGRGGMGEVYRARHALLRRPTAVKLLLAAEPRQLRRFEQEVQLTAQLSHPNTIVIYDYGHTPDGVFYYAMEYVEGLDLSELVRRAGPLPPERAIHLLLQVCAALSEAHGVGLVHRDVKPENVVVGVRGGIPDFVKVLDFGLVKELGSERRPDRTADDVIAGTPHYMSPEAILGAELDPRADLYAVGCVGYYLLTGEVVFEAESVMAVCGAHLHQTPRPASSLRPDVPGDLEAVLLACLAKEREERPASADELAARLSACEDASAWTRERAAAWWSEARPARSPELEHAETLTAVQVDLAQRAAERP